MQLFLLSGRETTTGTPDYPNRVISGVVLQSWLL